MEQYPMHGGFGDDAFSYMQNEKVDDAFDFTSEAPLPVETTVDVSASAPASLSASFKDVFGVSASKGGDLDLLVDDDLTLITEGR